MLHAASKFSFQMKAIFLHFIWKSSSSLEEEWRGAESAEFEVHCEIPVIRRFSNFHLLKSFIYEAADFVFQQDVKCDRSENTATNGERAITVFDHPIETPPQRIHQVLSRGS